MPRSTHAAGLIAADVPALLIGDFNVVPTDGDIYAVRSRQENALLHSEPRAAFTRLLAQGWTDAVGDMHPGEAAYTYKRDAWARDAGRRIDRLLVSPALLPRLADGGADRGVRGRPNGSDHAPVWIGLPTEREEAPRAYLASYKRTLSTSTMGEDSISHATCGVCDRDRPAAQQASQRIAPLTP